MKASIISRDRLAEKALFVILLFNLAACFYLKMKGSEYFNLLIICGIIVCVVAFALFSYFFMEPCIFEFYDDYMLGKAICGVVKWKWEYPNIFFDKIDEDYVVYDKSEGVILFSTDNDKDVNKIESIVKEVKERYKY